MANSRGRDAQLRGSRGLEGTLCCPDPFGAIGGNLKEAFLKLKGLDYPSQCSRSRKRRGQTDWRRGLSASSLLCPTLCNPMDYVACQAPLSMGFSRQEYWSGLPFPSPGDLPDLGITLLSCVSCTADGFFSTEPPGKPWRGYGQDFFNTALVFFLQRTTTLLMAKGHADRHLEVGSSWPRDQTHISCIPGGFFTHWAVGEANNRWKNIIK